MKRIWTMVLAGLLVSTGALVGCQHGGRGLCGHSRGSNPDEASMKGCDPGCLDGCKHGYCPSGMTTVGGEYIVPTEGGHPVYTQPSNGATIR